jgi:NADPH-dependent 2,4-dienoyl-CoA reductase/sulfur reductase-like enzyme
MALKALLAVAGRPGWESEAPRMMIGIALRQARGHWDTTPANAWGTIAINRFAQAYPGSAVGVTIARLAADWSIVPGSERELDADAVAVGHGFTPRLEAAIAAGCELTPERFVRVDGEQATSVPGVYAAGEVTGIGGVEAALAEGGIAGAAASITPSRPGARRHRDRTRAFASRIEAAHGVRPGWTTWLRDDTLVCRCEEVTAGALRRIAIGTATTSLRSLKLTTRAGLGICQGRVCGRSVEAILGTTGTTVDRRPIFVPVRLGQLAGMDHPTEGTTS